MPTRTFPLDVASRSIRDVVPMSFGPYGATGEWTCTRCSTSFAAADSWAVRFGPARRHLSFVVCPDCAARYRVPRPVTLDLTRLDRRGDGAVDRIVRLAQRVSTQREPRPQRELTLRLADVRVVARDTDLTPQAVIERLGEHELLSR